MAQLVEALRYKRVRFPVVSLEFFIDTILPAAQWPWGRITRPSNISWGVKTAGVWGWQNYSTFMCRLSWNLEAPTCWKTQGFTLYCTSTVPMCLLAGVGDIFVFITCTKPGQMWFFQKHCECIENIFVNSTKPR